MKMKLPQISLRDLFWLVALVAMGCGWWVEQAAARQASREAKQAKKFEQIAEKLAQAIDEMGGTAVYWCVEDGEGFGVRIVPPLPPIELSSSLGEDAADDRSQTLPLPPRIELVL